MGHASAIVLEHGDGHGTEHAAQYWQRTGTFTKRAFLEKLLTVKGSGEAVLNAMQEHKGSASLICAVRNRLYEGDASALFRDCRAIALNWDGSNYHGKIANVGIAVNLSRMIAAHMRPLVTATNSQKKQVFCFTSMD